ncbi:Sarcosine oxidase, gamma subunit family [Aquimixticola soesokkakensis]|uniref:Sarcosine oxidase, gamma subunit family n=1 Tax=Aquimixticola soesokkakensis TaxID=1519096 RepID=A0A1Y5T5J9_9RHOB|nr:sarcosine oxidase subunit gamma family protein [Aquimixticola soesokkakensis]SLN55778.1 Sarcosine oxidase, gamma subunit family [Aquimixticola soesokkakensis]
MAQFLSSLTPATLAQTTGVTITTQGPMDRLSLRTRADPEAFTTALGVALPRDIAATASSGALHIACLGPDDWVLVMPSGAGAALREKLAPLSPAHPHSLTDISAREVTLAISGPQAGELLTLACPRDIAQIAVGTARRTVFDGVTVVLWRDEAQAFRMDVWNSFAPFVAQTLTTGARECAAQA